MMDKPVRLGGRRYAIVHETAKKLELTEKALWKFVGWRPISCVRLGGEIVVTPKRLWPDHVR
jgi:hypothetical protein